jgi:hypothetical protein
MAMASIRSRLVRLEDKQRFLDWFVMERFYESLTFEELSTFVRGGGLPDPLPTRPSKLDQLDRLSLIKRWKECERTLGGRTSAELQCYVKTGVWPEQKGGIYSSMRNGRLAFEWRMRPEKEEV